MMTKHHVRLKKAIRKYISENGSMKSSDIKTESSKIVRGVLRGMSDVEVIKWVTIRDRYTKYDVELWGFKSV